MSSRIIKAIIITAIVLVLAAAVYYDLIRQRIRDQMPYPRPTTRIPE